MNTTESQRKLRAQDRARAWAWAKTLEGPNMSVWRLELIKTWLTHTEQNPGSLPDPLEISPASTITIFRARLAFMIGMVTAFIAFVLWVLRFIWYGTNLPSNTHRLIAIHGEWSTRTQHLLRELDSASPQSDTLILIGRLRNKPAEVRSNWMQHGINSALHRIIVPINLHAVLLAMLDLPKATRDGWYEARQIPDAAGLRDWVAINFRVIHGLTTARWWSKQRIVLPHEVIFSITGTADTTLLERAIASGGGRSVHVLHGQATGPNFVGISNLALFRSAYDASAYSELGCYGSCRIQPALARPLRTGVQGLLLLTNLAHPMNPGFQRHGLRDELILIDMVVNAVKTQLPDKVCIYWKPHPVIAQLPKDQAAILRQAASKAGLQELPPDVLIKEIAGTMRWVVTSPSSIAIDMLSAGILSVVIDIQGTAIGTALQLLTLPEASSIALASALTNLDQPDLRENTYLNALAKIGPAASFNLSDQLV